ncbi:MULTISPECIES: Hpt domain-containing protein [Pseudomonas]|jgi:HPt (histidine-containing phosphotransfer) domain-containing protein|uniref:Hpt domain-containing protein n=1 Tax=Serpens gallinarum TaxID=2763075 RepID=A0ABR8TRT5_9PSED|nr:MULTISPECIES: Hpt domain-containing protein [Pseudomonas]MBD7978334.1 Hpt domain-containing protein [Serpens gallinarum]MBF0676253.1 Hpt domain-containing protein [Pseudomonas sp.]
MYGLHIDQAMLNTLQDIMEDEYPALLDTYLADSEERLSLLRTAVREADPYTLREAAHSFKGSCSNMGVSYLADLCQQLELCGQNGDLHQAHSLLRLIEKELTIVRVLFRAERRRYA